MPKRRTSRKRRSRTPAPRVAAPEARPVAPTVSVAAPTEQPTAERAKRPSTRDYSYIPGELWRIVVLAVAILVVIVVLSFFLP